MCMNQRSLTPLEAAQKLRDHIKEKCEPEMTVEECKGFIAKYCREEMEHGNFSWRKNPHYIHEYVVDVFEERIGVGVETSIHCVYHVKQNDMTVDPPKFTARAETLEKAFRKMVKTIKSTGFTGE